MAKSRMDTSTSGGEQSSPAEVAPAADEWTLALPHRIARAVVCLFFLAFAAVSFPMEHADAHAYEIGGPIWALVATTFPARALTMRVTVRRDRLIASGLVVTRRVPLDDLTLVDVDILPTGVMTNGLGIRLVAVRRDHSRTTLTFDPLRGPRCRHYSRVAAVMNDRLGLEKTDD